ncbi:hypothetical protein [uncultured Roseovarius sp.]|uniref:hypothetical protein n=1 Tax=uncultured Roseovarius sp. TaxID=293344 RepID=UPI0026154504|nr:hypothetical protein [uncultured Roseovarius sp.]
MARLNFAPFALILLLASLAFFGPRGKAFNGPDLVRCAYELAELDAPAADVLFIGSSRYGRGFDPGYMRQQIKKETGKDLVIERVAMTFPRITQLRPPVENYLEHRGAPEIVFLQLMYNFKPERQRQWDIPVNPTRNVAYANLDTLLEIRRNAKLNDFGTALPRTLESGYLSLPALLLQKLEANIYAGMRYVPMKLKGALDKCTGDALHRQSRPNWYFNNLHDDIEFKESEEKKLRREKMTLKADEYLAFSPSDPMRSFEVDQLRQMAEILTAAGSKVVVVLLPVLGDTSISQEEIAEIETAFPEYPLVHPYGLFDTEVGPELAKSFADTTHASTYGALIYSRFFTSEIMKLTE